jgi:hypothetical protein
MILSVLVSLKGKLGGELLELFRQPQQIATITPPYFHPQNHHRKMALDIPFVTVFHYLVKYY